MKSLFGALGQNAIALEEDKTEGFILARIFVDGPDDFFYFSELLEICFNFIVRCCRKNSSNKHFTITSLRFFRINLFAIKFMVPLGDDSFDGIFVDEKNKSETA